MSAAPSTVVAEDGRTSAVVPKQEADAAGGLVWREGNGEPELLLVYRANKPDWGFPKGSAKRASR